VDLISKKFHIPSCIYTPCSIEESSFIADFGSVFVKSLFNDFVRFSETQEGYKESELVLRKLYEQFLDHLSSNDRPFLIAIGGSPGAGKTRFRKKFLKMENVHLHDMDEVMVALPGYQEDLIKIKAKKAFEKWWRPAREMAQTMVRFAIESNYSIIYDRTCGAEGSYFDFLEAKKRGYHLQLIGLYVDKNVANERVLKREWEEGRAMTEAMLSEYRARFSALWPYYLDIMDEIDLYQMNGEIPELIFSSKEGIRDLSTYQVFLMEGDAFKDYFAQKLQPFSSFN